MHFENKTHVKLNMRHVVAKMCTNVHKEGSGGTPGPVAQGMTGIGIVGELLVLAAMFMIAL